MSNECQLDQCIQMQGNVELLQFFGHLEHQKVDEAVWVDEAAEI